MSTITLPHQTDVVIVGAGPVGLVAACFLRKSGINVVVIDASPEAATTSRAAIIHLRTLEVLEKLDLAQPIIESGLPIKKLSLKEKDSLISLLDFTHLHDRFKHAVALPQTGTEKLLTEKLNELGGNIYRGVAMTDLIKNDEMGVELNAKDLKTGEIQHISAKYLIAADGMHSRVRDTIGVSFEGSQYNVDFLTADVHLDSTVWPYKAPRDEVVTFLDPAGFLLMIPYANEENNLWRVLATVEAAPKNPDIQLLDYLVRSRGPSIPKKPVVTDIIWASHFHVHHRLAGQYRRNRVFLSGDAAHVHSPAGGQGMNIGIQDAAYLADVIADALLAGRNTDDDLNRYEKTRRPVAQGVVALTHRLTTAVTMKNPLLCWLRNWAMWGVANYVPGVRNYMAWQLSELEH